MIKLNIVNIIKMVQQRTDTRTKAFGQHDHVRRYGQDYKDRLKNAGFKVTEDDYQKKFSADEISRFGFFDKEMIYYCEK